MTRGISTRFTATIGTAADREEREWSESEIADEKRLRDSSNDRTSEVAIISHSR
jgi:hypothetical protein